tara:strand:+ start:2262 stop:2849 length:588 start_codon:yes stop_codon:yes gene_type:complete
MDLVFATNNLNKLFEIRSLLPESIRILALNDINCTEELLEEQDTLEGNALQKARYIYNTYGVNCFADDTGLEIEYLDGKPGVYSARYAGEACIAEDNINKVLLELEGVINRSANFRTVIALIISGEEYIFEGKCQGLITEKRLGKQGFGYDPIFLPLNSTMTFAEMSVKRKGEISHRGRAVSALIDFLSNIKITG